MIPVEGNEMDDDKNKFCCLILGMAHIHYEDLCPEISQIDAHLLKYDIIINGIL